MACTTSPVPLLPPPGQQALSLARRSLVTVSYFAFGALLLYASGLPALVAAVLQHLGALDSTSWAFKVLFPIQGSKLLREDGSVDLVSSDQLTIAIPWFLMSIAMEVFLMLVVLPRSWQPQHKYRVPDTISSLSTGALYLLVAQVAFLQWGRVLYKAIYRHLRLTDAFLDANGATGFWLCFLATDFLYYVYHRASHQCSWLWTSHSVHHSSEEYNLSTALRQPALDFLAPGTLLSTTSMAFLFTPELAAFHGQISLLYQFWIHTQLVPPLPVMELVFNTPSLHRIHHARNPELLGKNFGSVLSVWDRLFRSLEQEKEQDAKFHYGVIPPLNSWNPVWTNLSHWHHLLFVQRRWHGLLAPLRHWTPPGGRCPRLGSRLNPCEKYDVFPDSLVLRAFIVGDFWLVLALVAVLVIEGPPVRVVTAVTGCPASTVKSVSYLVAFLLTVFALTSIAMLESAKSRAELRQALASNIGTCISAVALFEGMLTADFPMQGRGLLSSWQMPLAGILLIHAVFWVALWPCEVRSARERLDSL